VAPIITHYFDYKSPYAYLAQAELFELHDSGSITVDWLPYTLDISQYLGTAELGPDGKIVAQTRNAHQWRRVKYAYMDCRREANKRGLTLRGPQKIFDTSTAHIGFLYAKAAGNFRGYHDEIFTRFWRRELDIENPEVIEAVLANNGIECRRFPDYLTSTGRRLLQEVQEAAESDGVFGVPSYVADGELFWGAERFADARARALARSAGNRR